MQMKCGKIEFSKWDRVEFKCDKNEELTLGAIVDKIVQTYHCKVDILSATFGASTNVIYTGWEPTAAASLKLPYVIYHSCYRCAGLEAASNAM